MLGRNIILKFFRRQGKTFFVAFFVFVIAIIAFAFFWPLLLLKHAESWTMLSVLSSYWYTLITAITLLAISGAAWSAFIQLSQSVKATKLQALNSIIDEISEEEIREVRRWVLTKEEFPKCRSDVLTMPDDDRRKSRKLAVAYNRVAFFIKRGYLTHEEFSDLQGRELKLLWDKLSAVVYFVRIEENRPHYCQSFEYVERVAEFL